MWYRFAQEKEDMTKNGLIVSVVILFKKETNTISVLLNERAKNKWELPGGKVDPGESSQDGAIREIKEETNIIIDPKKLFTIDELIPEYKKVKKCNYYGYIVDNNDNIIVGSDAINLQWFPIDKLPTISWDGNKFVEKAKSIMFKPDKDILIFVDIDGVLNVDDKEHKKKYYKNVYNLKEIIEKDKVKLLNQIYQKYNPTFILASHWRKYGSIYNFNKLFEELGFQGQFAESTPFEGVEHDDRWKQIKNILKKYDPKKYIIFDDKHISLKKDFNNPNYIHVDSKTGLTQENIEQAIGILEGK